MCSCIPTTLPAAEAFDARQPNSKHVALNTKLEAQTLLTPVVPMLPLPLLYPHFFSDLGCHIDGFIATQATTVVVSPEGLAATVTGKEADLIEAARTAFNAALRLIKPGGRVVMRVLAGGWGW